MQDIQRTIQFGYSFDIPEELQFSGDNLAHMLISNGKIHQLPILRFALSIGNTNVSMYTYVHGYYIRSKMVMYCMYCVYFVG